MNLLLRPLEDPNDPVWSVILMIAIGLMGTAYVIYYILKMASEEALDTEHNLD